MRDVVFKGLEIESTSDGEEHMIIDEPTDGEFDAKFKELEKEAEF